MKEEAFRRRLLALLEKERSDLSDEDREELVDVTVANLDLRGDLTWFWKGYYGVKV